ncbi:response regulator [Lunatibacter salilacus]|uniref:response regulator n=1 Tax=Lunatibacter salilacus TaxID=2483804 RepID=UPI00131B53E7|nr:response regulator [Lunatibacter salilacus]
MKSNLETVIVDDDKITLLYLEKIVAQSNLQGTVHMSQNGKEGIETLDKIADSTNKILVLLDINMPVLNGWGFLDNLKGKDYDENTQVIIVTSSTAEADKIKSKDYKNVIGFLEKPISSQTLLEVVTLFDENYIIR